MKYVIGVLATIAVAIFAIILIVSRGEPPRDQNLDADPQADLTEYVDTAATVSFTTEGELTADEERRAIRVRINRNERVIEILTGYDEQVERSERFSNNQAAFDAFMHGLKEAGFTREQEPEHDNEKGICPFGRRYLFELREFGNSIVNLWATSCDNDDGTFGGNRHQVRRLFEEQIPDYRQLVNDVDL